MRPPPAAATNGAWEARTASASRPPPIRKTGLTARSVSCRGRGDPSGRGLRKEGESPISASGKEKDEDVLAPVPVSEGHAGPRSPAPAPAPRRRPLSSDRDPLDPQQRLLARRPAGVAAERPAGPQHAVAGHDDRDRVGAERVARRARGASVPRDAARPARSCASRRTGSRRWPRARGARSRRRAPSRRATSKRRRSPAKYSSSSRRTSSRRAGASRIRGDTRAASRSSTASRPPSSSS